MIEFEVVGFTGPRDGMTEQQQAIFSKVAPSIKVFHHGDCVGCDAQSHDLVRIHAPSARVVIHPPIREGLRAFCKGDITLPPRSFLWRDRDIVRATECLVATPKEKRLWSFDRRDSGTWYTIEFAGGAGKPILIIWPDGEEEKWGPWPQTESLVNQ